MESIVRFFKGLRGHYSYTYMSIHLYTHLYFYIQIHLQDCTLTHINSYTNRYTYFRASHHSIFLIKYVYKNKLKKIMKYAIHVH